MLLLIRTKWHLLLCLHYCLQRIVQLLFQYFHPVLAELVFIRYVDEAIPEVWVPLKQACLLHAIEFLTENVSCVSFGDSAIVVLLEVDPTFLM